MAVLAVYLGLFKDWRRFLSPGERAVVLLVAADTAQAKILFRYIVGLLKPKLLHAEIDRITANEVELRNGVTIEICACSYRSVRGRSVAVALLDEVAFWPREDSASPDAEVFNAVRAAQATFGREAMVIASSSPYSRSGILWEASTTGGRRHRGHNRQDCQPGDAAGRGRGRAPEGLSAQQFID